MLLFLTAKCLPYTLLIIETFIIYLLVWKSDSAENGLGLGGGSGAPNRGGAGANAAGRSPAPALLRDKEQRK